VLVVCDAPDEALEELLVLRLSVTGDNFGPELSHPLGPEQATPRRGLAEDLLHDFGVARRIPKARAQDRGHAGVLLLEEPDSGPLGNQALDELAMEQVLEALLGREVESRADEAGSREWRALASGVAEARPVGEAIDEIEVVEQRCALETEPPTARIRMTP
jgi:hypothetical protein